MGFGRGAGAIMLTSSCRCWRLGRCGTDGPGLKLKPSASAGSAASVKANRGPARAGIRHRLEGACELAHFLQNSRGGHRWVLMLELPICKAFQQPEELGRAEAPLEREAIEVWRRREWRSKAEHRRC